MKKTIGVIIACIMITVCLGCLFACEKDQPLAPAETYPEPSPSPPARFGKQTLCSAASDVVYVNYEYGAAKGELSVNRSRYEYTYFGGRNFDFSDGKAEFLPQDVLWKTSALTAKEPTVGTADFQTEIKPMIISKYEELKASGYFCGFPEQQFSGDWNGVYAQQFIAGDSNSTIFGLSRPYVSALIYNENTKKVYLLKDAVLGVWQNNTDAGAPTSDEYAVTGSDLLFQTFEKGMTVRSGSACFYTDDYSSPNEYLAASAKSADNFGGAL